MILVSAQDNFLLFSLIFILMLYVLCLAYLSFENISIPQFV